MIDERAELDDLDRALLRKCGLGEDAPEARSLVLVGRLQRRLGVTDDGRYGPHTHTMLRRKEPRLGRKLAAIVKEHRGAPWWG